MESRIVIGEGRGATGGVAELRRVLGLLLDWRKSGGGEVDLMEKLPLWLSSSFSRELTKDEKMEWLRRWRSMPAEQKSEMERERGWEFAQWVHWFSSENQFWSLASVSIMSGNRLDVRLECIDYPFPMDSFKWLVEIAGCEIIDDSIID